MLPDPPSVELESETGVRDTPSSAVVVALVSGATLRTVLCARVGREVIDVMVVYPMLAVGVMKTEVVTVTRPGGREDVEFCGAKTPAPGIPRTGVTAGGSRGGRRTGASSTPLTP